MAATSTSMRGLATPAQRGVACSSQQHRPKPPALHSRRTALGGAIAAGMVLANVSAARALGLESVDLPPLNLPEAASRYVEERNAKQQKALESAEASFQDSDLLATLKQRSQDNRSKNKREIQDKYCSRQAELGVGDCGGLRLIPGATKSGVQKRPEWLNGLFGLSQE